MNRIIKISCLLVAMLLFSNLAGAAEAPRFIVYFTSGKCTKLVAGKVTPLKKGDQLRSADQVVIGAGGKAILVCSNYNTVQLNKVSSNKINALYAACLKAPKSFTASYFRFVWDEFSHPHSSPEKEPEKYMRTAGAVTRGKEPVDLKIPLDTIRYYSGEVNIRFDNAADSSHFSLYKFEGNKRSIVKAGVFGNKIQLSSLLNDKEVTKYEWQLASHRNQRMKGGMHTVIRYAGDTYQREIDQLLKAVVASNAAETNFMKAFLLEKHHFIVEAEKYYRLAATQQPGNKVYAAFVSRF